MTPGPADSQRPLDGQITASLLRASVYRILSLALAYPTVQRLDELRAAAGHALAAGALPASVTGPLAALRAAAGAADGAATAGEHVFLFARGAGCAPYEGAYGPPQMAGKAALLADVAGFYEAFGLEPGGELAETGDHVCAELEFMSVLAVKEAWALVDRHADGLQITRQAATRFVGDHLGRWADAFADALQAATALPLYTTAADLLRSWLAAERRMLGASAEPVTGPASITAEEAEPFVCPVAGPGRPG